jgi:hypothetical protein
MPAKHGGRGQSGPRPWPKTRATMVHMHLAGDRANGPLFIAIAQDLRLQIGRDGRGVLLGEVPPNRAVERRRNSRRTNGGHRHPHQWQDSSPSDDPARASLPYRLPRKGPQAVSCGGGGRAMRRRRGIALACPTVRAETTRPTSEPSVRFQTSQLFQP